MKSSFLIALRSSRSLRNERSRCTRQRERENQPSHHENTWRGGSTMSALAEGRKKNEKRQPIPNEKAWSCLERKEAIGIARERRRRKGTKSRKRKNDGFFLLFLFFHSSCLRSSQLSLDRKRRILLRCPCFTRSIPSMDCLNNLPECTEKRTANARIAMESTWQLSVIRPRNFHFSDSINYSIMSQQGAALQNYNNELVKCTLFSLLHRWTLLVSLSPGIEDLCAKRDELQRVILTEEEDKHKLENEIRLASEKLAKVNESLAKKITARTEFDRTISETEAAYMKILESSQTLLNVRSSSLPPSDRFVSLVVLRSWNANLIPFALRLMIENHSQPVCRSSFLRLFSQTRFYVC